MQNLGTRGAAQKARLARVIAGTLLLASAYSASAQGTNPPAGTSDNAPSEAARRAAASPYRFILQSSTAAPRKPAQPAPPTAAAAPEPKKAAPVQQAAVQPRQDTQTVRAVQPTSAAPEAAPAPQPAAPEQAVAALSRAPVEPPVRREIIPVRTDEPRVSAAILREAPRGAVTVEFDIQPDGSVSDARVINSSNRVLNRPTTDAVRSWKFQPVDEILTVRTEVVYNLAQ